MRNYIYFTLALAYALFSCTSDQSSSEVQSALDEWFPKQYKVVGGTEVNTADSLVLIPIASVADPKIQFTVDYQPKKEKGGLVKEAIQSAFEAAKVNAEAAGDLLDALQKNGFKNVVVGTNLAQNAVEIQLYEEPFNSIFTSRIKQIQKASAAWAAQRNMVPCRLNLKVMDPKAWGKRFDKILDARFVNRQDSWVFENTIATANADLADPGSAEFLPGSLSLSGKREMEVRKKIHADVVDFLRTSKKLDFHVELIAMVNTEWDLRNMETIRYYFPYCQQSETTKTNGSCMGNFDGRISCVYDFKTGRTQVDF
ncbi:MAG: hypothetical protein SFV55_24220 [Haliscomenobacter sp.]|uniref:hypothetical protein n=1 Tax=Haliscomenobacter sp. TaxID=2717303 RepID=UPI0029A51C63|nr:hypothetical protein [Haliscomenobacter sp.]MDX2071558.1 hypothetical protein [Haliscomenobacter sp.]